MEKETVKHLNRKVAISVAVVSTFMALSKVKDDNIVQAMAKAKADSVDVWNQYQSKKIKQHLAESAIAQNKALKAFVPAKAVAILDAQEKDYLFQIQRYQKESGELSEQARSFEKQYDSLNFLDDQFDLSDACLSLALMLLAVTALTAETWLMYLAWSVGGLGLLCGISGFIGGSIHPDWIIRLLS